MLKSIALKNWRSHKDSTLTFAKGTDIIIGRMGGGKSSVIDSICFALFGTCPAIQHRRLKVGDYIRSRPDAASEATITLVFDHKGEEYTINRTIKKTGTTEGEILKDGRRIEGPQSAKTTEFIEELLDINYELFTRAIYSEQNRIDFILTLPKGERKKQIDELLGLDRFEDVRKNATTAVGRIKVMFEDRKSLIKSFDSESIRKEIVDLQKDLGILSIDIEKTKAELSSISSNKNECKSKFDLLESSRIKYNQLKEKIAGLSHSLSMLESDLKEARFNEEEFIESEKKLAEAKDSKQKIQAQYNGADQEFTLLSKKSAEITRSIFDIQDRIKRKQTILASVKDLNKDQVEKEVQDSISSRDRIVQDLADKKAAVGELEKAILELDKEIARCPVCDSDLPESKKDELKSKKSDLLNQFKQEIDKLKISQADSEKSGNALKLKLKTLEESLSRLKEFEGLEERLETQNSEKLQIDSKLEQAKMNKAKASEEINKINEEFNSLSKQFERMKELKNKQEKFNSMKKDQMLLNEQISQTKFNEEEWKSAQKELEQVTLSETKVNGDLASKVQKEKFEKEKLMDREKRIKEIEKYEAEIKKYEETIEKLQVFSNAIIETQQSLRSELVAAINAALSEVWTILYPYADYPVVKLEPSDSDYDLVFRVGEEWLAVDGIASGGERALACLALKVSFAMVLTPNLSWLILDEPTHNLDEEAVRTLAVTLHDHIPKIVEQTFVVTHDENLKDAASAKLFRIERNKEVPEISNVEEITV